MKRLIQLTLATVFVVITVLTVNINKADAAAPCFLQDNQTSCIGFASQGTPILFTVQDQSPFQEGARVFVRGACNLTINVPPYGGSVPPQICQPTASGQYSITNDGPDSVEVTAQSQ